MPDNFVEVKNVVKNFGDRVVLNDVSYRFEEGIYTIHGSNGVGKTTLLRIISNNLTPDSGEIDMSLENLMFIESTAVYPFEYLTGREFIELTCEVKGKAIDQEILDRYISLMNLEKDIDKYIHDYSTGMKSKIIYIIIFLTRPDVLLLDEPFSELDNKSREIIFNELKKMSAVIIIVTHNLVFSNMLEAKKLLLTSEGLESYNLEV